ncbi:hypothetical protein XENORESO_011375 [Xenotaenia resolanae]|uniref:Uncharacterized protein n=1 Tax=Xenotaenia resolanae TaxID=208358 RepID=A0ABV0WJS0_9TELE
MCVSPWILRLPGEEKETRTGLNRVRTFTHKHTHKPSSLRPWHCWISHTEAARDNKNGLKASMCSCKDARTEKHKPFVLSFGTQTLQHAGTNNRHTLRRPEQPTH